MFLINGKSCICTANPDQQRIGAIKKLGNFSAAKAHPPVTSAVKITRPNISFFSESSVKKGTKAEKAKIHAQTFNIAAVAHDTDSVRTQAFIVPTFFGSCFSFSPPKKRDKNPIIKAADVWDINRIIPHFLLASIVAPTAPITNAGPEFTQNHIILFACEAETARLSKSCDIIFAPTGNPPIRLIITAHAEQPGSLNNFSVIGDTKPPTEFASSERTRKSEKIINGNSDGITVSPQRKSPFLTPFPIEDGSMKKSIIKPTEISDKTIVFL